MTRPHAAVDAAAPVRLTESAARAPRRHGRSTGPGAGRGDPGPRCDAIVRTLRVVPARLDRVTVKVDGETYVVDWATRDTLIEWLTGLPGGDRAIARFRGVGATRPVELDAAGEAVLLLAIENWMRASGDAGFSPGLVGLRVALAGAQRRRAG